MRAAFRMERSSLPPSCARRRGRNTPESGPPRPVPADSLKSQGSRQGQFTAKPEVRGPKEIRRAKRKLTPPLAFRFRPSEFLRISDFGLRIFATPCTR